LLCGRLRPASA